MKETDLDSKAPMGTIAWGQKNDGKLRHGEKLRLIGNLAYAKVSDVIDAARSGAGYLKPSTVELDDVLPNQDSLVQDALGLAQETHEQPLLFHSWRSYLFGALLADQEEVRVDRSLYFAAAILHDIGLTDGHRPHLCDRCFALSGGERAKTHLDSKGHPPAVGTSVGNAISLHLNAWVSKRLHGAEAHYVSRGAICDIFGIGRHRISRETLVSVLDRFPRTGMIESLRFGRGDHLPETRPAVLIKVSGGKPPTNPFRMP